MVENWHFPPSLPLSELSPVPSSSLLVIPGSPVPRCCQYCCCHWPCHHEHQNGGHLCCIWSHLGCRYCCCCWGRKRIGAELGSWMPSPRLGLLGSQAPPPEVGGWSHRHCHTWRDQLGDLLPGSLQPWAPPWPGGCGCVHPLCCYYRVHWDCGLSCCNEGAGIVSTASDVP